jgi:hypothetical protein
MHYRPAALPNESQGAGHQGSLGRPLKSILDRTLPPERTKSPAAGLSGCRYAVIFLYIWDRLVTIRETPAVRDNPSHFVTEGPAASRQNSNHQRERTSK